MPHWKDDYQNLDPYTVGKIVEYIRDCQVGLPIESFMGTKKRLLSDFATALAQQIEDHFGEKQGQAEPSTASSLET